MQREKLHNPQSEAYSSCVVPVVKETQNSVRPIFAAPKKTICIEILFLSYSLKSSQIAQKK